MKLSEIISALETWAPLSLQEEWDNSGLIIGDPLDEISGILLSLDVSQAVLQEALARHCNLIVSHHPLIFNRLTKLTPHVPEYKLIRFAIRHNIAILALHTNLDNRSESLNHLLGVKIGLESIQILQPMEGYLKKLVTFCPHAHVDQVREALFRAGAGNIGNYDSCSFNLSGQGSFRASDKATPFVGEKNALHMEGEVRVEVIFPKHRESALVDSLLTSHPYEEVAYDIYPLDNRYLQAGSGVFGNLPEPMTLPDFLRLVKQVFGCEILRHTQPAINLIRSVAVCSGSGAFLIQQVRRRGIDAFLTGDLKYHDFQGAPESLLLADVGHYESEQFVKEMLRELLIEKFPTFAVLISEQESNPIKYFKS